MSLLDEIKADSKEVLKQDRSLLDNPRVIIFASLNEDTVNKWLCVLNYFIQK
jgi:hypothetical protein